MKAVATQVTVTYLVVSEPGLRDPQHDAALRLHSEVTLQQGLTMRGLTRSQAIDGTLAGANAQGGMNYPRNMVNCSHQISTHQQVTNTDR